MRFAALLLMMMTGCTSGTTHQGNSLFWPVDAVQNGINNAAYSQQRGAVEVIVKSEFPAILADIDAGGGPVLTRAMDAARIGLGDRSARTLQLQGDLGLYSANPGALVTALMLFGG